LLARGLCLSGVENVCHVVLQFPISMRQSHRIWFIISGLRGKHMIIHRHNAYIKQIVVVGIYSRSNKFKVQSRIYLKLYHKVKRGHVVKVVYHVLSECSSINKPPVCNNNMCDVLSPIYIRKR